MTALEELKIKLTRIQSVMYCTEGEAAVYLTHAQLNFRH